MFTWLDQDFQHIFCCARDSCWEQLCIECEYIQYVQCGICQLLFDNDILGEYFPRAGKIWSICSSQKHGNLSGAWEPKNYHYKFSSPKDNCQSWNLCGTYFCFFICMALRFFPSYFMTYAESLDFASFPKVILDSVSPFN